MPHITEEYARTKRDIEANTARLTLLRDKHRYGYLKTLEIICKFSSEINDSEIDKIIKLAEENSFDSVHELLEQHH